MLGSIGLIITAGTVAIGLQDGEDGRNSSHGVRYTTTSIQSIPFHRPRHTKPGKTGITNPPRLVTHAEFSSLKKNRQSSLEHPYLAPPPKKIFRTNDNLLIRSIASFPPKSHAPQHELITQLCSTGTPLGITPRPHRNRTVRRLSHHPTLA
jgi:hypothetical protein